jgi:putative oxidoreductase
MFNEPGLWHALLLALVVSALYALRKRLPGTQLGRARDQLESPHARRRRRQLIALECTELALAGVFFLVGGAKLIGRRDMVELFRSIGFGQWLRYVTGVFEVVGAAFLVVPLASGASAIVLGTVMISATLIELLVLRRPPIAAMACLSAHTYVAWSRLLYRAPGAEALTPPTMEPTPADPAKTEPTTADSPSEVLVCVVSAECADPPAGVAPSGVPELPEEEPGSSRERNDQLTDPEGASAAIVFLLPRLL